MTYSRTSPYGPPYYGRFTWSKRDRNSYKLYLCSTDTSIILQTLPIMDDSLGPKETKIQKISTSVVQTPRAITQTLTPVTFNQCLYSKRFDCIHLPKILSFNFKIVADLKRLSHCFYCCMRHQPNGKAFVQIHVQLSSDKLIFCSLHRCII